MTVKNNRKGYPGFLWMLSVANGTTGTMYPLPAAPRLDVRTEPVVERTPAWLNQYRRWRTGKISRERQAACPV
jgi:hypothetical protein